MPRFAGRLERHHDTLKPGHIARRHVLAVNNPIGPDEREAKHVAESFVLGSLAGPAGPTRITVCQAPSTTTDGAPQALEVPSGTGSPMPTLARADLQAHLGHDFSRVRIHADAAAGTRTRIVGAAAYTLGNDISIAPERYTPESLAGRALLAHELTHVLQQTAGSVRSAHVVQMAPVSAQQPQPVPTTQPATPVTATAPALAQSDIDKTVTDEVSAELDDFNNITIDITGSGPALPQGMAGPPPPRTVSVLVKAVYYISRPTSQADILAARKQDYAQTGVNEFENIIRALRRQHSILESGNVPYTAGRAVELGKGSPQDVKLFVQKAVDQGVVERYALHSGSLTVGQQLIDLPAANLSSIIQAWMTDTGVGVDCSGFVLQAAIRARDAVRAKATQQGAAVPAAIGHEERSASSFASGPLVNSPRDLRPGDAWTIGTPVHHVRIVSAVRILAGWVEFDTAESAGDVNQPLPGQVKRTWHTNDLDHFLPIVPPGSGGGTFHQIT